MPIWVGHRPWTVQFACAKILGLKNTYTWGRKEMEREEVLLTDQELYI